MVDIKPGCEPCSYEGTGDLAATGILVLHGFTGSPASMRPWAEDLAARGFSVELPLLAGHGTHWKELQAKTWHDVARDVVRAFEALRARTSAQIAVGLSGGGLMALRLAQTRADDLAGIVLVNPWLYTPRIVGLLRWVLPAHRGVINDIAKPDMDEVGYDRMPLHALASMASLQRQVRADLPATKLPTLLLTSRQDRVVDTKSSTEVANKIGSDDFQHVWLERSYHVATLDYDYPIILEESAKFAERVGRASP